MAESSATRLHEFHDSQHHQRCGTDRASVNESPYSYDLHQLCLQAKGTGVKYRYDSRTVACR